MKINRNNDLISVIIPVYNVEQFLSRCIDSVINQTYKNIEIIIVDDGSTDNSKKICDDYSHKDNRIKIFYQNNMGLSMARNSGIDLSKGEWLIFVDSDDYLQSEMIEKLYCAVKSNCAEMAICNFNIIDESDNVIEEVSILKNEVLTKTQALVKLNTSYAFNIAWNKIYKKELFNSIRYPKNKIHEDEYVSHRLVDKSTNIACISNSLYMYRLRKDGIMGRRSEYIDKSIECVLEAYDDRLFYYYKNKLYHNYLYTKTNLKYLMRKHGVKMSSLKNNEDNKMLLKALLKASVKDKLHYFISCAYDCLFSVTHKKIKRDMNKIAILYICTNGYDIFWREFYESYEKHFIIECDKDYYVFTDNINLDYKDNENVHIIYQESLGWPNNTLLRYHLFNKIRTELEQYDYIYFMNANCKCFKNIFAKEFLPKGDKLVVVKHPGFYNKNNISYTYERNAKSTAYIPSGEGTYYVAGGIIGGSSKQFIRMIDYMIENIDIDLKNNIIAIWHDESHLNKYIYINKDIELLVLDPSYLYPEGRNIPYKKKILLRDKRKVLDIDRIKGVNSK